MALLSRKTRQSASRNNFCPIVRFNKYIDSKCEPDVVVKQRNGSVTVRDKNDTWSKISDGLDDFIDKFTGKDLSAEKYISGV